MNKNPQVEGKTLAHLFLKESVTLLQGGFLEDTYCSCEVSCIDDGISSVPRPSDANGANAPIDNGWTVVLSICNVAPRLSTVVAQPDKKGSLLAISFCVRTGFRKNDSSG